MKISVKKDPLDINRVLVSTKLKGGKEINTAFPVDTTEKEIKAELKKAQDLVELEKKQAKKQQKVDEAQAKADKLVSKLDGKNI